MFCVVENRVFRYEVRFLQGAFGQVTYELIFFSVQESLYGTYTCHITNLLDTGSTEITLESKHFSLNII